MVQQMDEVEIYRFSGSEQPPEDADRQYSDTIHLTKAPKYSTPFRYYRSTYDFSSLKRYKTVVRLEPTLAPIRYYKAINFGIPREIRHKSTVDCDFRPRARGFSETTWIFPKHGKEIYTSTLKHEQIMDSAWYKSQVRVVSTEGDEREKLANGSEIQQEENEEVHNGYDRVSVSSSDTDSINDELASGDGDFSVENSLNHQYGNREEDSEYITNNNMENEKLKLRNELGTTWSGIEDLIQ